MLTNKQVLAGKFSAAAQSYDRYAIVQKSIVHDALALHRQLSPQKQGLCLDLGCGTAAYARQLAAHAEQVLHVDLAHNMLVQARSRVSSQFATALHAHHFLSCDAENIALADNSVHQVFSSMALQWCDSPARVSQEIYRIMRANGHATLAILIDGSFSALESAWQSMQMPSRVNQFASQQAWLDAVRDSGFACNYEVRDYHEYHTGALSMLRSMKTIGADTKTTIASAGGISRAEIQQLNQYMQRHQALSDDNQNDLALNYRVLLLSLHKLAAQ